MRLRFWYNKRIVHEETHSTLGSVDRYLVSVAKLYFAAQDRDFPAETGAGFSQRWLQDTVPFVHFRRRSRISNREGAMVPRPAYFRSNARSSGLSLVRRSSLQQRRNHQQIVDKYGGADK